MDANCDIDEILRTSHPKSRLLGRYQFIQTAFLLLSMFQASTLVLNIIFIGNIPAFTCNPMTPPIPAYHLYKNITDYDVEYDRCDTIFRSNSSDTSNTTTITRVPCLEGIRFDADSAATIVSEWELVCKNEGLSELSHTAVVVGQTVGAFLFPYLADKYGRKPVFLSTHIVMYGLSLGIAFVPDIVSFMVIRLLLGMFQQGMQLCLMVLIIELYPMEKRGTLNAVLSHSWTACVIVLGGIGYFMKDLSWRYLQIATTLLATHCLFGFWIIDESLRWLVLNNKEKQAIRTTKKIVKNNQADTIKLLDLLSKPIMNDKETPEEQIELNEVNHESTEDDDGHLAVMSTNEEKPEHKDKWLDLFRSKKMIGCTMILCYTWAVNSLTYYGLYMASSSLSGNLYLNVFLNAIVEIPGNVIYYLIVNRIGRKKSGIIFHAVAGLSLIASVILLTVAGSNGPAQILIMILSLVGKMAVTASWTLAIVFTVEIFPTNLRNAGIGICSAGARIGGMVAPYSRLLAAKVIWAPGLIFSVLCLMVTYLFTKLPETNDRILPQTLLDFEAWFDEDKTTAETIMKQKKRTPPEKI